MAGVLLNCRMATKRAMPKAQREAEGIKLKVLWARYGEGAGYTQTAFCDSLGWNQGQLQQWFSGKTPIALDKLLDLSLALGFDPREVRPELQATLDKLLVSFKGRNNARLKGQLASLSPPARESISSLLQALEDLRDTRES